MASSQGGVGAVTALQSHHYSSGPHWSPGVSQYQHQQHHTARSLDRALEDAVCSGILNLSGRKLREYPGMSYDLTDTTQAGGLLSRRGGQETTIVSNMKWSDGFVHLNAACPHFVTLSGFNLQVTYFGGIPTIRVCLCKCTHILAVITMWLIYHATFLHKGLRLHGCFGRRFQQPPLRRMKEATGAPKSGAVHGELQLIQLRTAGGEYEWTREAGCRLLFIERNLGASMCHRYCTRCVFHNQTKDGVFTASPPSVGAYAHNIHTEKRKTLLLVSCGFFLNWV